jgi:hypothetical protein
MQEMEAFSDSEENGLLKRNTDVVSNPISEEIRQDSSLS